MCEVSRLLAGFALFAPVEALQAVERIDRAYLRDDRARDWLQALQERNSDLEAAPDPADLALEVSKSTAWAVDLALWAIDAAQLSTTALDLAADLKRMASAVNAITELEQELGGGVDGWRLRIHNTLRGGPLDETNPI